MMNRSILLAAALLTLSASVAISDVIHVPGDYAAIQEGISAALAGDTVLVSPGTYLENVSFLGKDIVLISETGPASTIIDGSNPSSPLEGSVVRFCCGEGAGAVIEGFTVTGGSGTSEQPGVDCRGGGIYILNACPTVRGNIITGNSVFAENAFGGGICCSGSHAVLQDNEITLNLASGYDACGGGIYVSGDSVLIADNTIEQNACQNTGWISSGGGICNCGPNMITGNEINGNQVEVFGGGIHSDWCGYIHGNSITGNSAVWGGGGIFGGGSTVIEDNTLTGNQANLFGGGIDMSGGSTGIIRGNQVEDNHAGYGGGGINIPDSPYLTVENNTILRNSTSESQLHGGGGILCSCPLYNCVIAENTTPGLGGGVRVTGCGSGGVWMINCTVTENSAGSSGGAVAVSDSSYLHIHNSILWDDEAPSIGSEVLIEEGCALWVNYSDIDGGQENIHALGTLFWGTGNTDTIPFFMPGPLSEYHIDPSVPSPCIDAGDPSSDYYDPEDPGNPGYALWPACGTIINDMGAYGGNGAGFWTGISVPSIESGRGRGLFDVAPNPCGSQFSISFYQTVSGEVSVRIYDLSGRLVSSTAAAISGSGEQSLVIDTGDLCEGIYFVTAGTGACTGTGRIVVLR